MLTKQNKVRIGRGTLRRLLSLATEALEKREGIEMPGDDAERSNELDERARDRAAEILKG